MDTAALIIGIAASLFLAIRGFRNRGLSFENTAIMAVVWIIVIAVLAFALARMGF